jgi:hypothetical protein
LPRRSCWNYFHNCFCCQNFYSQRLVLYFAKFISSHCTFYLVEYRRLCLSCCLVHLRFFCNKVIHIQILIVCRFNDFIDTDCIRNLRSCLTLFKPILISFRSIPLRIFLPNIVSDHCDGLAETNCSDTYRMHFWLFLLYNGMHHRKGRRIIIQKCPSITSTTYFKSANH